METLNKEQLAAKILQNNPKLSKDNAMLIASSVIKAVRYWEAKAKIKSPLPYHVYFGIIHVESRYNSKAASSASARGLMQVTPIWRGKLPLYAVDADMFDLVKDVHSGVGILFRYAKTVKALYRRDPTHPCWCYMDTQKAILACYNAGPTGMQQGRGRDYAEKVLKAAELYKL